LGNIVLRPEPVDLRDVCEHVRQVLMPGARAHRLPSPLRCPASAPSFGETRCWLEQIVNNLIGNALK